MRISKLKCSNFKSLVDFEITLAKFSCLVGLNGSGKSTILQFVDFLAQLMRGDLTNWLKEREWSPTDLVAWRREKIPITFAVEMANDCLDHGLRHQARPSIIQMQAIRAARCFFPPLSEQVFHQRASFDPPK